MSLINREVITKYHAAYREKYSADPRIPDEELQRIIDEAASVEEADREAFVVSEMNDWEESQL